MLLYWISDMACLAIAFLAVGTALPWQGLLIAYAAGQLAALLPITPGGLGVTEGSMAIALAAYGATATAVAAVLLYRLITYWAILPAGGICYLSLRRRHSVVIHNPLHGLRNWRQPPGRVVWPTSIRCPSGSRR
jgi:hypothetical protein